MSLPKMVTREAPGRGMLPPPGPAVVAECSARPQNIPYVRWGFELVDQPLLAAHDLAAFPLGLLLPVPQQLPRRRWLLETGLHRIPPVMARLR